MSLSAQDLPCTPPRPEVSCVYEVDAAHRIVSLGSGWSEFARDNLGDHLTPDRLLGRCLWDFVADRTTQELYRQIIHRALGGRTTSVPFRCDSSTERRQMEIEASLVEGYRCRFTTRIRHREPRSEVRLLNLAVPRSGDFLRACGWCKRIAVSFGSWVEVEAAVAQLRLFELPELPRLTHGICPVCLETLSESFLTL